MRSETVLLLLGIATFGLAENTVESQDVPGVCLPACQFTIDLSLRCDKDHDNNGDDDDAYRQCVCTAQDSQARLTECASCVRDNGRSDPDDNDVADLMDDCGWDFNNANGPYPSAASTTTVPNTPSSTSVVVSTSTDASTTVIVTPSGTPTSDDTNSPIITPTETPDSAAGALRDNSVVGPLLAGLIMGLPIIL